MQFCRVVACDLGVSCDLRFPFYVQGDPVFDPAGTAVGLTLPFTRSQTMADASGVSNPVNLVSHFIDGSMVSRRMRVEGGERSRG